MVSPSADSGQALSNQKRPFDKLGACPVRDAGANGSNAEPRVLKHALDLAQHAQVRVDQVPAVGQPLLGLHYLCLARLQAPRVVGSVEL